MIRSKSISAYFFLIWKLLCSFLVAETVEDQALNPILEASKNSHLRLGFAPSITSLYRLSDLHNKSAIPTGEASLKPNAPILIADNLYSNTLDTDTALEPYSNSVWTISTRTLSALEEVKEIFELPESEVEIGLGNLLIGKIYSPDIDVKIYLDELDRISRDIQSLMRRRKDPRKVAEVISTYLFDQYDLEAVEEPYTEDFLLHELLDTKKGRCMSLVALYMSIAERIDFPLHSVCLPEHIFVRWIPVRKRRFSLFRKRSSINIETTLRGTLLSNRHYEEMADAVIDTNVNQFYLRPLTKKEALATYLSPLGNALREHERIDDAIQVCRLSVSVNPQDAEAWNNLAMAYRRKGYSDMANFAYRQALEVYPNFAEAWQNLGTVEKDGKKRIEYFKKAISIKPELDVAWRNLVLAYYEGKNYELAWACANRCRALGHTLPASLMRELEYKIQPNAR